VILPSFTFPSAATAVTKFGAIPVFVDIEMKTKGIDVNQVREAITSRTKAISWVNYAGVAPDIEGLQSLAKEFNLLLIEDNAHGLGGTYKGKALGSFGDFATQSFHATKNIQCGEGGALVVNNLEYVERAEIIREKGTNRSRYIRGEVQKYQWVDHGSSYLLAETLSAILLGQLELFKAIHERRLEIHRKYYSELLDWLRERRFEPMTVDNEDFHTAHLFYILAENSKSRDALIEKMSKAEIAVTFHYQSLSESIFVKRMGYREKTNFNSSDVSSRIFRLPIYYDLAHDSQDKIISSLTES
jgi:dTDP-4-amino-4,6-dideoxygalactose transaminase